MCGEKKVALTLYDVALGSPPRVRGKVILSLGLLPVSRITPACAGKSRMKPWAERFYKDHPRVCGEKGGGICAERGGGGSPPRVRGKGGAFQ